MAHTREALQHLLSERLSRHQTYFKEGQIGLREYIREDECSLKLLASAPFYVPGHCVTCGSAMPTERSDKLCVECVSCATTREGGSHGTALLC